MFSWETRDENGLCDRDPHVKGAPQSGVLQSDFRRPYTISLHLLRSGSHFKHHPRLFDQTTRHQIAHQIAIITEKNVGLYSRFEFPQLPTPPHGNIGKQMSAFPFLCIRGNIKVFRSKVSSFPKTCCVPCLPQ